MNIAFFTETFLPQINGVTYTVDNWREELERRGHTVYVVYPRNDRAPRRRELAVRSIGFKPVDGYYIGVTTPASVMDRLPDIDVVHAHGPFSLGILGSRVAKRAQSPFILSHHTPAEQYFDYVSKNSYIQAAMDKIYVHWQRLFSRQCDDVLAPTDVAATRLQQRIGRPVKTLSNGINTEFFAPADEDAVDGFRERHRIRDGPVLGYCGRLGYEKHLEDLVALADRFDGEIVVAGDGFAKEQYLPQFREAGITYLGRLQRDEMPVFYSLLDAFVIPSTAETQGVSVLEANACGTPAIGADAQALKNTIEPGRNGYRYPQGDIAALEQCWETVRDEQDALGSGAREVAAEHNVETVVDRLESLYQSAAGVHAVPDQVSI